jgi:hypothetical protein
MVGRGVEEGGWEGSWYSKHVPKHAKHGPNKNLGFSKITFSTHPLLLKRGWMGGEKPVCDSKGAVIKKRKGEQGRTLIRRKKNFFLGTGRRSPSSEQTVRPA